MREQDVAPFRDRCAGARTVTEIAHRETAVDAQLGPALHVLDEDDVTLGVLHGQVTELGTAGVGGSRDHSNAAAERGLVDRSSPRDDDDAEAPAALTLRGQARDARKDIGLRLEDEGDCHAR